MFKFGNFNKQILADVYEVGQDMLSYLNIFSRGQDFLYEAFVKLQRLATFVVQLLNLYNRNDKVRLSRKQKRLEIYLVPIDTTLSHIPFVCCKKKIYIDDIFDSHLGNPIHARKKCTIYLITLKCIVRHR